MRRKYVNSLKMFALAAVLWLGTFILWAYTASSPITLLSGDSIVPHVLRAGDEFAVTRNFSVDRDVTVTINRTLRSGDCAVKCLMIDFTKSESSLKADKNYTRTRRHTLPGSVDPGEYEFLVSLSWQDIMGRWHSVEMKPLPFTVVR